MRTLTSTLLLLCLTAAVFADAPSHVHKYAGYSSLGAYEPALPKSLKDIPESVRTKLVAHLKKRLGEPFYSSLQLCGGQIVDFAEFHRRESGWKDYKWEVFAYNLHFEFRLADKGIEFYQASIRLPKLLVAISSSECNTSISQSASDPRRRRGELLPSVGATDRPYRLKAAI